MAYYVFFARLVGSAHRFSCELRNGYNNTPYLGISREKATFLQSGAATTVGFIGAELMLANPS
jgi:hypothetical protein